MPFQLTGFLTKKISLIVVCSAITLSVRAQDEPQLPEYENKVVEKDGKYFIQKSLPVYLKFSTSPTGKEYPLKSVEHPTDANPIYLDTEGVNWIRSRWAMDPVTRKPVTPQREVMMEIYADGIPPVTTLKFNGAPQYLYAGITYFGKGLSFGLTSVDAVSGVMETKFSIENTYKTYTEPVTDIPQGTNALYYYSADYVGNVEKPKSSSFTVDLTPPNLSLQINGIAYDDKIIAPSSSFILKAFDNLSGVKSTFYSFDKSQYEIYNGNISVNHLNDGEHTLYYHAIDNVSNEALKLSFNFYLDRIGPIVTAKIVGDQFSKEKIMYVSPRTTVNLSASDNKAGVKQITYQMDGKEKHNFSTDISFPNIMGTHTLDYSTIDNAENLSELKTLQVFMDNNAPETGIFYGNPQFFARDTLYITRQTPITLKSVDDKSGVKDISYSIDGKADKSYEKFSIPENGVHSVSFSATDNVNNEEQIKSSIIYVDNVPPEIYLNFSIQPIGKKGDLNIYPNYVRVYIGATDRHVGAEKILYSIDGAALVNYSSPQTLDISEMNQFKGRKKYVLRVVCEDKLGNSSEKTFEFYVGKNTD